MGKNLASFACFRKRRWAGAGDIMRVCASSLFVGLDMPCLRYSNVSYRIFDGLHFEGDSVDKCTTGEPSLAILTKMIDRIDEGKVPCGQLAAIAALTIIPDLVASVY